MQIMRKNFVSLVSVGSFMNFESFIYFLVLKESPPILWGECFTFKVTIYQRSLPCTLLIGPELLHVNCYSYA